MLHEFLRRKGDKTGFCSYAPPRCRSTKGKVSASRGWAVPVRPKAKEGTPMPARHYGSFGTAPPGARFAFPSRLRSVLPHRVTALRNTAQLFTRDRRPRLFFLALTQSALGSGAAYVAMLLVAYERFESPWAITAVLLADLAPS